MTVRDVVQAAAGVGGGGEYIEDVFSTYLYTGNGSTQTINNGIDLDGEGGLVWTKMRNTGAFGNSDHWLFDTARGVEKKLSTNTTGGQGSTSGALEQFNSDGYQLGYAGGGYYELNYTGNTYASWTLRKSPKFFDVVTYTGNGANRTIAHNLGSVPGCIIVKRTDGSNPWAVYHRKSSPTVPEDKELQLNATDGAVNGFTTWNRTLPTDAVFSVGTEGKVNENGWQYVAYLFAHDAGGFGDDGEQNVISCGSFTTGAGGVSSVNLGYEPQFILFKNTVSLENWMLFDTFRGLPAPGTSTGRQQLKPNLADEEGSNNYASVTSTGFDTQNLYSSEAYIYIAIRRGPMKTPESGTEVFAPVLRTGTGSVTSLTGLNFPPDMLMARKPSPSATYNFVVDRLRGYSPSLTTQATDAEQADTLLTAFGVDGVTYDGALSGINQSGQSYINHFFRRAPSVFDVVCYTGTGVAGHVVNHNLGVAPEWIITKKRSSGGSFNDWYTVSSVYYNTIPYDRQSALSSNNGFTGGGYISGADSTSFTLANAYVGNETGHNIVAYLFASVPNVSKVGTYTGTGSDVNVDCGFSSGARFVYVQRADATGTGKYVWDSARGIVSGNDPYLLINSTAAEEPNTDYIDPLASGFTVTSNASSTINISEAIYFFLAIA
jgi:hypothetical protein